MRRYELQRLFDAMGRNHRDAAEELGISGATRRRLMAEGLTERQADRYAVRAGMAAENVWPELLDDLIAGESRECANDRCANLFVPTRRNHVYCTQKCARAVWARTEKGKASLAAAKTRWLETAREYDRKRERERKRRIRAQQRQAA